MHKSNFRPRCVAVLTGLLTVIGLSQGLLAQTDNPFANRSKADDVFYHIMPIAWRDGADSDAVDANRDGDFPGMRNGLDYLDSMGFTAMWMNPIFPSPAYHGYQHGAADTVNPRFGTEQDFTGFLTDANARGIEVYIDFVTYGISDREPLYQSAFGNPASEFDTWLAFTNASNTTFTGADFPTWNGDQVKMIHWDHRNPEPTNLVTTWARKWLDPNGDGDFSDGVSGYRLDHVWVNYCCGPDGWGYNRDTFWQEFHNEIRSVNPGVFTLAEQADWSSHGAEFLGTFGAAFTKPFEFDARSALASQDATSLYASMAATIATLPATGTYMGIIGDHDVDRLSSAIGADSPVTQSRERAAAAVLMLQPFPPVVYYGDEIGMLGTKRNYGSDANDIPMREPFKWNAVEGAPMTRYHRASHRAFAGQFSGDRDGRSVQEQSGVTGSTLETYRALIKLRKANVALRRGNYVPLPATSPSVWVFGRRYEAGEAPITDGTQSLISMVNLNAKALNFQLDLSGFQIPIGGVSVRDLVTGEVLQPITESNKAAYPMSIGGHTYRVLEADM